MDAETSAARIAAILRDKPFGYCVACLAARLDVLTQEVRNAAQLLVTRPGFRVVQRACYACGSMSDGVVALIGDGAAPRLSPE